MNNQDGEFLCHKRQFETWLGDNFPRSDCEQSGSLPGTISSKVSVEVCLGIEFHNILANLGNQIRVFDDQSFHGKLDSLSSITMVDVGATDFRIC